MMPSKSSRLPCLGFVCSVACSGQLATAQWTAVRLHTPQMYESAVYSVTPGAQAGFVDMSGILDPAIWSGSASSLLRVQTPSLPFGGTGFGVSGSQLVGQNSFPLHAFVYDRASGSVTDLHPPGAFGSKALAVENGQQVGFADDGANSVAALWSGSASSFVNLNPAGASWSIAHATNGVLQGGDAAFGSSIVAGIWSGSAASFVNLNPPLASGSQLRGMGGDQQVGTAKYSGSERAALWRGSAASYIDLNPPNAGASLAYGTDGLAQVGYAHFPTGPSATIWFGSAASAHPLHQYLPPGYDASIAYDVVHEGDRIIVGGIAYPDGSERSEAFLWVYVPTPSSLLVLAIASAATVPRRRR